MHTCNTTHELCPSTLAVGITQRQEEEEEEEEEAHLAQKFQAPWKGPQVYNGRPGRKVGRLSRPPPSPAISPPILEMELRNEDGGKFIMAPSIDRAHFPRVKGKKRAEYSD